MSKRKNDIIWLKSSEELNAAMAVLKEECEYHYDCNECPLSLVDGSCGLMNCTPIEWSEVQDD
jgi:hypothetical protein